VTSTDFHPAQVSLGQSPDPSPLRLFLSFNPPPSVVNHLNQAQKTLRDLLESFYGAALPIRWTRSFQFHLTVLFFGNTAPAKLNSIRTRLIEVVGDHPEFPCLTVKGFGCFPAFRRPRVLWIGFAPNPLLRTWPDRLANAFAGDFVWEEKDRSYPHVTIARLAFGRLPPRFGEHLVELAEQASTSSWNWQIDSISLMRGIPGPKGSEYIVLMTLPNPHAS
jgi:2'-5' RNA ligase